MIKYEEINIVIPVYNEGENLISTLCEIRSKISIPYCIHVVYDFEEDTTLPPLRQFILNNPDEKIELVKNYYGRGALNAIKTGMESFPDGAILVVMADLSDDLAKVSLMFEKLNDGFDLVCGSRYMKGGDQIGGPKFKSFLSRMAGVSLHYLTGLPTKDATNSFKLYTKKVLNQITIESNGGFELGIEIFVKAYLMGFKIAEVPSIWRDREAGESNFKLWKWLPNYLKWYFYAIKGKWFGTK